MLNKEKNTNTITPEEKVFFLLRLDKSRRRWRLLSLIMLLIIAFTFFSSGKKNHNKEVKDYIAEIKIEGIIFEDSYRLKKLEEIKDDKNIKAVILTIDSPGGSMVPGLEILEALRAINIEKPLVVQMKTVAASAGFLISLAGDYVVANKASLTGSVGVMMPLIDATQLANKIGVKSAEVTSGDLKSITSPLNKRTEKASKYLQSTVNSLQEIFMDEVKQRRSISKEVEDLISDGRFIIGAQAYDYKLIDALGDKQLLIDYLHSEKEISKNLDIVEISLEEPKKMNFQDVLADQLTSKISNKLETLLYSGFSEPKMLVK